MRSRSRSDEVVTAARSGSAVMSSRNLSMRRALALLLLSLGLTVASMGIANAHVNPDFQSDFSGTWAVYGATPFTTNGHAKMDLKATTTGGPGWQYVRLGIQRKACGFWGCNWQSVEQVRNVDANGVWQVNEWFSNLVSGDTYRVYIGSPLPGSVSFSGRISVHD